MKLTLTNEYYTVSIKSKESDESIHDLMEIFKQGALALGYQPESVNRGFEGMVEEINLTEGTG